MTKKITPTTDVMDRDDSARTFDVNGWTVIAGNPISKAGVVPYLGKHIPGADPNRIYYVLRPKGELSAPETIESAKLIPWINDHQMLGPLNGRMPAEQKGVEGVTGQDIYFADDTLYANIKLYSSSMAQAIADGKVELSAGYSAQFEQSEGFYKGEQYQYIQRNIRFNHLALVDVGRMGPSVAVLDQLFDGNISEMDKKQLSATLKALLKRVEVMDADDDKPADDTPTDNDDAPSAVSEMTIEEATAQLAELMPLVQKLQSVINAGNADDAPSDDTSTMIADADDAGKKDDDKKDTMDAADVDRIVAKRIKEGGFVTTADVMRHLARRDSLVKRLTPHVGVFDAADMTEQQVAEYGVAKLGLKAPKGSELVAIDAALQVRKPEISRPVSVQDKADKRSPALAAFLGDK